MDKSFFDREFEQNLPRFLEEWKQLLSFASVSTDPAREPDCLACAEWLKSHLEGIGFQAEILPTPSKPCVFASWPGDPKKPTVLFYGHYDVQPADPLALWKSDPFKPELRDGRLYARGAQDNKGQTFYFMKAIETLIRSKGLQYPVKILLEGEEESGSSGITAALPAWRDRLAADVLMVCDTGSISAERPTITMGLRGIIRVEVKLSGPYHDLHSGVHGGLVKNPAVEMAKLLATLYTPEGGINVKGYYDGIRTVGPADRRFVEDFPFDPGEYARQTGAQPVGGERGLSPAERRGFRPTIEINGLHSGYDGPGTKTIIPAQAFAKLTSRLVEGQDPDRCLALLIDHLKAHAPEGLKFELAQHGVGGAALSLTSESELIKRTKEVLDGISGRETILMWEGASIPIIPSLSKVSGGEPLLVGFGLEEDSIHAPNESFSIAQLKSGFMYVSMMLSGAI